MSKLQEYNGRYCESEFENAFISFLEDEGWNYLPGSSIVRDSKTAVQKLLYYMLMIWSSF